ncbi:MAG: MATE family efflux transporter [Tissierellia bacterium]|nr:MATE family efflux transporter [Tissierellia bacterium]
MNRKNIAKRLWILSYPTMISFAMQSVYDIVDMIWVGRISSTAVAGVTVFTTIFWLFEFLNEVIGAGSISLISQNFGREDMERTQLVAEQTISFKTVMALCSALALYLSLEPLMTIYTKDPAVIQAAKDYGLLRIYFIPIMFLSFSVNTIFRCTGDTKTPMIIMLTSTILNIILDPIFMFDTIPYTRIPGLGLGVRGASIATVISTSISFTIGFSLLLIGYGKIKIHIPNLFQLHKEIDRELILIGLPNGFQMLLRFLFQAVLMSIIARYGIDAISAAGIGGKVYNFAFLPINGMMMGGSILVGHFLGKEEVHHAEEASTLSSYFNLGFMFIFTTICVVFSKEIYSLFIQDQNVITLGSRMLIVGTLGLPFLGFGFGRAVAFLGSGHNQPLLIGGILSQWVVQLPLMILAYHLGFPVEYIFATYFLADLTEFFVFYYIYRRGTWKTIRVK